MTGVAGVVLAAGSSVRMGRNKLLLELGGETVVRRAVRIAHAAELDPVVVVTGHQREAVEAELHGLHCSAVFNDEHALGQHTSVRAGVAALGRDCAAAIVILADMPFVTAGMLRTIADRHAETGAPLVVSHYGGDTMAPPILYARRLFPELTRVDRRCGRQVVQRHRAEAVAVDWPREAMRDLDRPSDYADARRALGDARTAGTRRPVAGSAATHE
ncbi:MAG: nucleotidyltransferase family protein [Gemmatimonadetes bacterium]|nr:nucleotidyltransferase family protein [Gemmatimonadota bacterium]MXX71316.1 nucleotidyltransferase family protein [Gemmatimonadota bacterium]MYC91862.1 nucleotidyltransferase family protein [Gemmatimonadota bacterium]MYG36939.1 nucleotidyltransferase family protein [Gemmatimonadota bacterium]